MSRRASAVVSYEDGGRARAPVARSGAVANSAIPSSRPTRAVKPSTSRARSAHAKTWRTSPRAELARDDRLGAAGGRRQRARHVADGARRARGDVERARRRLVRREREDVGAGDVAHVDEVAQLPAVLEDPRRLARRQRASGRSTRRPAYGVSRGIRGP